MARSVHLQYCLQLCSCIAASDSDSRFSCIDGRRGFCLCEGRAILVGGKRPEAAQRPTWRYDARKGPPHPHTCLVGPTGRRPRSAGPAERLLAAFSVRPSRWAPRVCSVSCIHRAKHPVTAVRAWCVTERWAGGYWEAQMSFGESGGEG